jgi:DNA-binding NarL/FixJ family response regulator
MSDPTGVTTTQNIYTVWHTDMPEATEPQGGILILADTGVAFQGLLKATQKGFPNLDVTLATHISPNCEDGPAPRIILLHAQAFRDAPSLVSDCREAFPETPIALMVDAGWSDVPALRALVAEKFVQGLLPFRMRMNVWLATVWLLLNGGEYFPSAAYSQNGGSDRQLATTVARRPAPQQVLSTGIARAQMQSASGGESQDGENAREAALSSRETEVLELMAQGLQNKLIAAQMRLSEHTVKVHVHNVIRKLHVHNRTQAAAVFRQFDKRQLQGSGGFALRRRDHETIA